MEINEKLQPGLPASLPRLKPSTFRKQVDYFTTTHSFIILEWFYNPLLGPGLFFSFIIFFTQSVGLLGRKISPSQGRYIHTGQHKQGINADRHDASSGIRTHDPSVRAGEDSSCLRLRSHCDRFRTTQFYEVTTSTTTTATTTTTITHDDEK
jgi:hypothetical protein